MPKGNLHTNMDLTEKYYTDEVAEKIERLVNLAKQMMQEIAVLDYAKVA